MIKQRFQRGFRWATLLLVPMLIIAGCAQSRTEPAPTSVPNPSTGSVAKATPAPTTPPTTSQVTKLQEDVLYEDNFKDPKSGWPNELVFGNYFVGYHEPEYYHVEVRAQHDSAVVVLPGRSFDNFSAEMSVFADEANTAKSGDFRYGLVIRRSGNQFYAFTVSPRTKTGPCSRVLPPVSRHWRKGATTRSKASAWWTSWGWMPTGRSWLSGSTVTLSVRSAMRTMRPVEWVSSSRPSTRLGPTSTTIR